jgi:hypothetical protein
VATRFAISGTINLLHLSHEGTTHSIVFHILSKYHCHKTIAEEDLYPSTLSRLLVCRCWVSSMTMVVCVGVWFFFWFCTVRSFKLASSHYVRRVRHLRHAASDLTNLTSMSLFRNVGENSEVGLSCVGLTCVVRQTSNASKF